MKKAIAMIITVFQFVILIPAPLQAVSTQKRLFMVSAYYSPLPNQSFYMKGSYEADKILNGRGTNGADGTEVYVGMLAAPRNYPFGTRINLPGLGVGAVHDRGGAIIAHKNYDRIDVWMGKGEEGLSRALNWGMRLVEGEVDFTGTTLVEGLSYNWVSSQLPSSTLSRLMAKKTHSTKVFSKPITPQAPKVEITELQESLRILGYYSGYVDGDYNQATKDAVMLFQMNEGVIADTSDEGAGVMGPETSRLFKRKIEELNSEIVKEQNRLKASLSKLTAGIGKDSKGGKVIELQKMLWELGYYKGPIHQNYDLLTSEAVFAFQQDYGLVQDSTSLGAGHFGPKTHKNLTAAISKKSEVIKEGVKQMQSWVPSAEPLPNLDQLTVSDQEYQSLSFGESLIKSPFVHPLSLGSKGGEVVRLQEALIKKGYLEEGFNTGFFGQKTRQALIDLQKDKNLIENEFSTGAGRMGPSTMKWLNAA